MLGRSMGILLAALVITLATGCGDDANDSSASGGSNGSNAASEADTGPEGTADSPDSSESGEPTGSSLSGEEFVQQANAICLESKKEIIGKTLALRQREKWEQGQELKAARAVLFPGLEAEIAKIRELEAPASEEGKAEVLLKALEQAIGEIDEKELSTSVAIQNAFEPVSAAASKADLTTCDFYGE